MSAAEKKKKEHPPRRPWRDNLEAVTMAIVMAVMLKYFIVEAYKIPTGSMQPTLMGNEDTGIFDRILVDKLSFHFRDPERFEIVVFKYPLDRSKNFIKRLCGMPGEDFRVFNGDLWTRKDSSAEWKVLRRPKPVQDAQWKFFDRMDPRFASWKPDSGARAWKLEGRSRIEAHGNGSVTLPNDGGSVMDKYIDGYPGKMGQALGRGRTHPGHYPVGDLRLTGSIRAAASCRLVTLEFHEGDRVYRMKLPGPAAGADERAGIEASALEGRGTPLTASAQAATRLVADKSIDFSAQNMDDLLELELGGTHVELEIPAATDQRSSITVRVEGDAVLEDLEAYRDIYYTSDSGRNEFTIPPGNYLMLGDNTQDSSDSREWSLAQFKWKGSGDAWVRGNNRDDPGGTDPSGNPRRVTGDAEGARLFFRDEWGELHNFLQKDATRGDALPAPFVPRELIAGRAVLVFWPLWPFDGLGVWRLKWAR